MTLPNFVRRRCSTGNEPFSSRRKFIKLSGTAAAGAIASCALSPLVTERLYFPVKDVCYGFSPDSELFWRAAGQLFCLDPGITYLNTGTEGSMPKCVVNSLYAYLKEFAGSPMECSFYSEEFGYVQENNIDRVADFLGVRANEIVLTANTTQGMNLVLQGLDFGEGAEVVTTTHEHGAALSPLHLLRDRRDLIIKKLPLPLQVTDKNEILSLFFDAVTENTRALCFSHINYTTGLRMPVKEICEMARRNNLISIVDGAHALGMLNVNLDDLGCDFYAASGHKWLNGPPGTGILYIRDGETNPHDMWPCNTEIYDIDYPAPITSMLQMCGQQNTPALRAMTDAMSLQTKLGRQNIESRILELAHYLKERITALWGDEILISPVGTDELCSGLVSFIPFRNHEDRYDLSLFSDVTQPLREHYNIYIRWVDFPDSQNGDKTTYALRVSTHIFNTFRDIDRLLEKIQFIMNS